LKSEKLYGDGVVAGRDSHALDTEMWVMWCSPTNINSHL